MLKGLTIILIIFAFSALTFNRAVIMLDYYVNTGSFAKNCENKAKPAMHCNGKCQMMKQMKNEEKKDQQAPERKGDYKIEVVSSKSFFARFTCCITAIKNNLFARYTPALSVAELQDIFHPPAALPVSYSLS
jgi:hypothetical protein